MPTSPRYAFRVTDRELAAWLDSAGSITETVIAALKTYRLLERNGHSADRPKLVEMHRQLVGVATNINQLAHTANRSGERTDFPSTATIEAVSDELSREVLPQLRRIIRYYAP